MPVLLSLLLNYEESKVKYVTAKTVYICLVCHKVLAVWLIWDNFKQNSNLKTERKVFPLCYIKAFIGRCKKVAIRKNDGLFRVIVLRQNFFQTFF